MKRFISAFVAIVMVLTSLSIMGYASDDAASVVLEIKAGADTPLPPGTRVAISVLASDSAASSVEIYETTSGDDALVSTISGTSGSFVTETAASARTFYAVALDDGGEAIGRSEAITLPAGYKISKKKVIWDIDFENNTLNNSGANSYVADSSGTWLTNPYGKTFSVNIADEEVNSAAIDDDYKLANSAASDMGNSFHLSKNVANKNVQLNKMYCPAENGRIQVFEMDVYGDVDWESRILCSNAGNGDINVLKADTLSEGTFKVGSKTVELGQTNDWRHITLIQDIEAKTLAFLVDGVLIDYHYDELIAGTDDPAGSEGRFTGRLGAASKGTGDMWYDNFYVYSAIKGELPVKIEVNAEENQLPKGFNVPVKVSFEEDGVQKIDIYSGSDASGAILGSVYGNSGSISVSLSAEPKSIYAVAKDANGNSMGSSIGIVPAGFMVDDPHYLYNFDFENLTTSADGSYTYLTNADGSNVHADGHEDALFYGHTGDTTNTITVETPASLDLSGKGKALRLNRTTDQEIQLNRINTPADSGIVVFEMDFYSDIDTTVSPTSANYNYFKVGTGATQGINVTLKGDCKSGKFSFAGTTKNLGASNSWRHFCIMIDMEMKTATCFVDGVLIASIEDEAIGTISANIIRPHAIGDVYIDNFKVYETHRPPVLTNLAGSGSTLTMPLPYGLTEDEISSVNIIYQRNRLSVENVSCSDGNITVTTCEPLYTAVEMEVTLNYLRCGYEGSITVPLMLSPLSFDVLSVTRTGTGNSIGITAELQNTTGEPKTAVMVLCYTDACGRVMKVRWSDVTNVGSSTTVTLAPEDIGDAVGARVFFYENHTSLAPIKGVVYKIDA